MIPAGQTLPCASSVLFSCSLVSDSLRPHGLQHTRLHCPSSIPKACSNSCPSSQSCHPAISSSVVPFSSRLQSFPASGSFPMSQFFTSGGKVLKLQPLHQSFSEYSGLLSLGWPDWISLQNKGLPRVFSNTIVQKRQFFGIQLSL